MNGWLIKQTSPGVDPTTRPITEVWAASYHDAVAAIAAVEQAAGVFDPPAETAGALDEETLKGLGLTAVHQVRRVVAQF